MIFLDILYKLWYPYNNIIHVRLENRKDGTNMKKQGKKNRIFAGIAAAVMAVSATAVGMRSYSANAADLELDNYAKLLQYSLYFYDANMCGDKVEEQSAFSWRGNCHTGDVALGGFHDAGDGIMRTDSRIYCFYLGLGIL